MAFNRLHYLTLVPNTPTAVALPNTQPRVVQVVNRNGLGEIWYTLDGSTPAAGVDDVFLVTAGVGAFDTQPVGPTPTVTLVSAAACTVGLELLD